MSTAFENDQSSIVEFQLGNKQLFLLFLGLLVICAIFFFIGLRVGEDTAKAKIPVTIDGASQANNTSDGVNEQTLALQPLAQPNDNKVVEKPAETPVETKRRTARNRPEDSSASESKPAEKTKARQNNKQKEDAGNTSETAQKPERGKSPAKTGIFVQVLSSTDRNKAQQTKGKISKDVASQIQSAKINGKTYYRVLIGPFNSRDAAGDYRKKILPTFKDAFLQIIR